MPFPVTCRLASADEQIAVQYAVIAKFEAALWDGGFNAALLSSYQSAWRLLEALIAVRGEDRTQVKVGHTGGSTGNPLALWYDDDKYELMRAGMMRSYMLSGWRPGQKILNFWGARQDVVPGGVFGAQFGDAIAAEHTIAAHEYTEEQLVEWAHFIQRYGLFCCRVTRHS
ncbi:MAG: hypothetical protein Q8K52_00365 [Thiobacillus sp.]|nr:hypothetical protein [Thiobacillus sp.]